MDVGSKLAELDLTREEVERLSRAFRDERFRALLREYADEIACPENRRRYEQELKQLEQERGVDVTFVHPTPQRVLKTSVDGKRKCFINVCTNELVRKPEGSRGRGSAGELGCHWSLPYSLSPGREHVDSKGCVYTVYDVIFHPDTLHMAWKNERFMGLVDSTALQGVQSQFGVRLDENNVKVLKIKYKGVPNPSVIRKPMPGWTAGVREADENDPSTKPHYTCARDSASGPRPKEMVVTIDLPLLKSAGDADLNVTERRLLLQSQSPAYRLELPLPYPVDENKGQAKFSKPKGQLTVTLPVQLSSNFSPNIILLFSPLGSK
uniref:Dynein axonemal assembly factor 2 n=1 Tax=Scleropages formosus TaxID=113540 RepID=A0A8C9TQM6_SCLFO